MNDTNEDELKETKQHKVKTYSAIEVSDNYSTVLIKYSPSENSDKKTKYEMSLDFGKSWHDAALINAAIKKIIDIDAFAL